MLIHVVNWLSDGLTYTGCATSPYTQKFDIGDMPLITFSLKLDMGCANIDSSIWSTIHSCQFWDQSDQHGPVHGLQQLGGADGRTSQLQMAAVHQGRDEHVHKHIRQMEKDQIMSLCMFLGAKTIKPCCSGTSWTCQFNQKKCPAIWVKISWKWI